MVALGLEAVLVGDVVEGVGLSVGRHPADGSADAERLLVGAGVLKLGLLLAGDSIARLIAVKYDLIK